MPSSPEHDERETGRREPLFRREDAGFYHAELAALGVGLVLSILRIPITVPMRLIGYTDINSYFLVPAALILAAVWPKKWWRIGAILALVYSVLYFIPLFLTLHQLGRLSLRVVLILLPILPAVMAILAFSGAFLGKLIGRALRR